MQKLWIKTERNKNSALYAPRNPFAAAKTKTKLNRQL